MSEPRIGIMAAPTQVDYQDILRVWREADTIPDIEHAWLFDHLLPIVESLAEACTVIRRLWTEPEPFDLDGTHVQITGAFGNPKPLQHPHSPIMIGRRSASVLRVAAEHADLWNIPGGDIADAVDRSALLDRYCREIGRDPAAITRSIHLPVSYDQPDRIRYAISEATTAGFSHIVLGGEDAGGRVVM